MRFRVTDRMLAALSGLLIIALGIALGLFGAGLFPDLDFSFLEGPFTVWQRTMIITVAVLLCLLGIHGLWMLFRRRADKGFIMQRTDMGDMSIAMSALKSMVKKCVDQHQEVSVKKIFIHRLRNGVIVDLKILLANGINIPLTVNVLQKQIKQYITSCSGVDVHEVRVQIDTSNLPIEVKKEEIPVLENETAPAALLQEEPVVETAAESILRHTEEPADYVETVAVEAVDPVVVQEEMPADAQAEPSLEEIVENAIVDEIPEEAYVEETIAYTQEDAAEMAETEVIFTDEALDAAEAVAESYDIPDVIEESQEMLEDIADTVEETTASAENELWAQVGEAFVRQDETEETAE